MSGLRAMRSVYCYFFPEVRPVLRAVEARMPDDMYLVTTSAEQVYKSIEPLFSPPLAIPATVEGYVDLDEIHVPVIDRITSAYSAIVPCLKDFKYRYPTAGSSEGIREILKKAQTKGTNAINVLDGEYEGYGEYAKAYGMTVNHCDPSDYEEPGTWFISNPSAVDGNIIPNDRVTALCDSGHKVVLDLAYVGATRPYEFDVSHENVSAVVMSFSKPYGVFRFRIGGIVFSRDEIPSLYGNKWFKDTLRLCQALKLAEDVGPHALYPRYRPVQEEIIGDVNKEFRLDIKPSDSLLLGHLKSEDSDGLSTEQLDLIEPFKRGSGYRFCFTPYFEEKERGGRFNG